MTPQPENQTIEFIKERLGGSGAPGFELPTILRTCEVFARSRLLTSSTEKLRVKGSEVPAELVVGYSPASEVDYEALELAGLAPPNIATHKVLAASGFYDMLFCDASLALYPTDAMVSWQDCNIRLRLQAPIETTPFNTNERSVLGALLTAPEEAYVHLKRKKASHSGYGAIVLAREPDLGGITAGFIGTSLSENVVIDSAWIFEEHSDTIVQCPVEKYLAELDVHRHMLPLVFLKGHGPA